MRLQPWTPPLSWPRIDRTSTLDCGIALARAAEVEGETATVPAELIVAMRAALEARGIDWRESGDG